MDPLSHYMLMEMLWGIPVVLILLWLSRKYPPKEPTMPKIVFDDRCIWVDGEELECTSSFQCEACGAEVDGETPKPAKNIAGNTVYSRTCPHCQENYPLHPWTEK